MKRTTLLNRSVFAALLLSASVSVFAGGGGGGPRGSQSGWHPYANTASAPAPFLAEVDVNSADAHSAPAPLGQAGAPVAAGTAVHGKTRAQVRAELLQAEEWWRASGQLNASGQ